MILRHTPHTTKCTWYCFPLLLGCTLHGHVATEHKILVCTRCSAFYGLVWPSLTEDVRVECLLVVFTTMAYKACTEAGGKVRCQRHLVRSAVGNPDEPRCKGICSGGFLRSIGLYARCKQG